MKKREPGEVLSKEDREKFFKQKCSIASCFGCKYWNPWEHPVWHANLDTIPPSLLESDPYWPVSYEGFCKRYPPQWIEREEDELGYYHPETSHTNWCGEWIKAKDVALFSRIKTGG